MACDPNTLAREARCLSCLSPRTQLEVQTYQLAVIAGGSLDPNTLAKQAKGFSGMPPAVLEWMKTYLLCQLTVSAAAICAITAPVIETEEFFGAFNVMWLDYTPDPAVGFRVEAGTSPGASDYFDANVAANLRNYEAGGIDAGTYWVRVIAIDSETCEATSNEVQVTI